MKKLLTALLILLLVETLVNSCANPATITGGPKDTIPPTLLWSDPENQTLNYKEQTITLTFDEFVSAEKLKQSLIITPTTDLKYKHLIKKRSVILKFDSEFEDSTTYTFSFFDGITDITEKNPVENLIIAISTGNYIDSIYLQGSIKEISNDKPVEQMTVGLYTLTDSLNIFKTKPTYFYNTDKTGQFKIQNVKIGRYKILAFKDENRNLIFDPKETYAFLADTLNLQSSPSDSLYLKAISVNAAELKLTSARPSTKYFEARYSKPLNKYETLFPNEGNNLPSQLTTEKESIKFYNINNISPEDSILTLVTTWDSLQNQSMDTLYIKFRSSSKKSDEFKATLVPQNNTDVFDNTRYSIIFNKPIEISETNFALISIDTLINVPATISHQNWNYSKTALEFELENFNQDFIKKTIDKYIQNIDTTSMDSTQIQIREYLENYNPKKFTLHINKAAFISVENDTVPELKANYTFGSHENYGSIVLNLSADNAYHIIQLMKADKVVTQQVNCHKCIFQRIPAGNYWFRILIDENQNGKWDIGNIRTGTEPEPVIHLKKETTIRANWENQLDFSF